MEHELRTNLLSCARAYADAKGMRLATLARLAAGDWRFFSRLENEKTTFTARKYDEVIQWLSDNWPEAAPWPAALSRPTPSNTGEAA